MFEIIRKGSKGKQVKKKYRIGTLRPLTKVSPHFTKSYYTVIKDFFKNLHNIIDTLEDDDIISISETIDTVHLIEFLDNIDITREYLFDVLQYNRNNDYTVSVIATINEYNKYNKTILPDYYSIMVEAYNDHNQDFLKRNLGITNGDASIFINGNSHKNRFIMYAFHKDKNDNIELISHWCGNDNHSIALKLQRKRWLFFTENVTKNIYPFGVSMPTVSVPFIHIGNVGELEHSLQRHLSHPELCLYIDDYATNGVTSLVRHVLDTYFSEGFLDIIQGNNESTNL